MSVPAIEPTTQLQTSETKVQVSSMNRISMVCGVAILSLWSAPTAASPIGVQTFHDRASYNSVLLQQGRVPLDQDWNEEEQTEILQGQLFGTFSFQFDPAVVQPVVGAGIVSGLAVGAEPDGRLKGDQGLSLVVTPGVGLTSFGTEIVLAPFETALINNVFQLIVGCDTDFGLCAVVGNLPDLNAHGGSFFLGVIADSGVSFDRITIDAVTPRDDSGRALGFVPEWQIASITSTSTSVPEPSTVTFVATGVSYLAALGVSRRRIRVRRRRRLSSR
jgi:hypothetical protein